LSIDDGVDLGGQPAAGSADGMVGRLGDDGSLPSSPVIDSVIESVIESGILVIPPSPL
jgi:hypothetical protein